MDARQARHLKRNVFLYIEALNDRSLTTQTLKLRRESGITLEVI